MVALAEAVDVADTSRWPLLADLDAALLLERLADGDLDRLLRDPRLAQLTIGPRHALLARLIVGADRIRFRRIVAEACTCDELGVNLIAAWLQRTVPALIRARHAELRECTAVSRDTATHRAEIAQPALHNDPVLLDGASRALDLPLLPFLADLAPTLPAGRVIVSVADLGGIAGCADRGDLRRPATITLDRMACRRRHDRDRTWAHELGHLCDRDVETIAPELAEQFADELGNWLEQNQPVRFDDARSAISTYDHRRRLIMRGLGPYELPEPGLDSHLAFAFLPLGQR